MNLEPIIYQISSCTIYNMQALTCNIIFVIFMDLGLMNLEFLEPKENSSSRLLTADLTSSVEVGH